ncbi:MAG: MarR family transcriptional regulator [Solirubrobacterales bacterium]|nr:MarR family transcriptional regulator [Solirubrobacterales bacterium]
MASSETTTERIDLLREARRQWEKHWGEEPAPSMAAVTTLMRAQQIVMSHLNLLLAPFDLTFARYEALMLLYFTREGSLPLGKIGERLQVHPTSVTSLIDRLERDGYVERTPHPSDRRTTLATLTVAGRNVAGQATQVLNADRFGMDALSTESHEELILLLDRIRETGGDEVAGDLRPD